MPIENRIESLDVRFQPRAQSWFECYSAYVLPARWPGFKVRITETRRDAIRQEALAAQGASKLKLGYHNFGLGLDFAVFDDHGVYEVNDSQGVYSAAGHIAKALGMEWGGDWQTFKDYGHLQFRPDGCTIETLTTGGLVT
jgi:peptidoglycan L-alanyl-D-glutamate endopeptidase CwlK